MATQVTLPRLGQGMESGTIVALLPDGGWKYLSTGLFAPTDHEAVAGIRGRNMW